MYQTHCRIVLLVLELAENAFLKTPLANLNWRFVIVRKADIEANIEQLQG